MTLKKSPICLFLLLCVIFIINDKNAWAACDTCRPQVHCAQNCVNISQNETNGTSLKQKQEAQTTIQHLKQEFTNHRRWITENVFAKGILPALMLFTEQISAMAMNQVVTIGMFLDAKHQLETQRLFQELTAQAHKDYHPSEGMCTFGTTVRSLAASDRNTDLAAIAISNRARHRELLSGSTLAGNSNTSDFLSRVEKFRRVYCNKGDNGMGLELLCPNASATERTNNDIDYTVLIDSPLTLNLDMTTGSASPDIEDVLALAANLYAHTLPPTIPQAIMTDEQGEPNPQAVNHYMNIRAIAAKRSVATNSFAAIASMKTRGQTEVQPYLYALIKEMGVSNTAEIQKYLGERPSYYAQMEVLTKKLYQNPMFYTDLYDKPANVGRKAVAMQAIALMQKRDIYRSALRTEAILSVMAETAVAERQDRITNEIRRLTADGELITLP